MVDNIDINTRQDSKKWSWRCNFHFNPPVGLINDPNGLCYYKGYYYIFFQWYPYGCSHGLKHWGLIKTKDFTNYTKPEIVLTPDSWYDKDGCYSGSSIVKDGKIQIIYSGNVRDDDSRRSYQCLGVMNEFGIIEKYGPVLDSIPKGYTSHFRDPKIFVQDNKYCFIIGAQSNELKGKVLLYSSEDFHNWQVEGEIKTGLKDFGYMWECPNYLRIDDSDILIFSPQGLEKEEFRFQNIYQSGYIVGKLDFGSLEFSHGEFKELDKGFDFYAPQIMKDDKGRIIMIGWMGMAEEEDLHPTRREGWVHSLTMPRELKLKDGILYQKPVEEIKNLRKKCFFIENKVFNKWSNNKIFSYSYELLLMMNRYESEGFEIKLAMDKYGYTSLKYDFINQTMTLDRGNMMDGPKGIRKVKLVGRDSIKIHIFMDKSALEVFIEDGREVMSARIYPQKGGNGLEINSIGGQGKIEKMKFWSLEGVNYIG